MNYGVIGMLDKHEISVEAVMDPKVKKKKN